METWKDVPGYEGIYQISTQGRIKSLARVVPRKDGTNCPIHEKIMRQGKSSTGYRQVSLCVNGSPKKYDVHKLMAITFLGHVRCGHKRVIDHIDGNPENNNLENLREVTNRENTSQKNRPSTSQYTGVSWHKHSQKWYAAMRINGKKKFLGTFDCEHKAGQAYIDAVNKL